MRTIDADKTYEVLTEYYHHRTTTQHEALKDALSRVPTIEPKRGKWEERFVKEGSPFFWRRFYCSACGDWTTHGKSAFCPNCGAKMGEEE